MTTNKLGRLERVDLRVVWENEPGGFTPWLAGADNLKLLGDTIGIELELEAQEKNVGPFKADILCKDSATGNWVLIENQLESTDHTHLGQLLTYAAGLKAVTIVWIAQRFTEEHRAALDWLNEITDERFTFFGLEVELWRIGDSEIAPKFNVVCQPNDWTRTVAEGASLIERGELTDAKLLQFEFWTDFRRFVLGRDTVIKPRKPQPQHWMDIAIGKSGVRLAAIASLRDSVVESYDSHEIRAELILDSAESKQHFALLLAMKDQIETEVGEAMLWHNPENRRMSRISVRQSVDLENRSRWPEYHEWLLNRLELFHRVFSKRVRQIAESPENRETEGGEN